MEVRVGGDTLWFDVEGPSLVPSGAMMRLRPTVVMVHGGPGTWDHSYLKPEFSRLADYAQVVYLDLPGHGRSTWGRSSAWSFEACADAIRDFCDTVGIAAPVVFGHSMGAAIVLLYGVRHPDHPGGLVACSGYAHFDVDRLVDAVRRFAGEGIADIARRSYGNEAITEDESARLFAAFGPVVPDEDALARRRKNSDLAPHGARQTYELEIRPQLDLVRSPTLVCVGALDPITPVDAAREIVDGIRPPVGELLVFPEAGHFPWLDVPDLFHRSLRGFVASVHDGDEV